MKPDIRIENAPDVPLRGLKAHPDNARRGNVDLIVESLAAHGQYRPIVIDQNNTILAGHHVVQAAKKLGWTRIAAVQVDVTPDEGRRILLADNRTTDLATYDHGALLTLLDNLPDLTGTGYGSADMAELDALINGDPAGHPEGEGDPGIGDPVDDVAVIRIGALYRWEIDTEEFNSWLGNIVGDANRTTAIRTFKHMLGLPNPPLPTKTPPSLRTEAEFAAIDAVTPHPSNAREGDIGAVAESLRAFGQYRPIVANRRTTHIVSGNHTHAAAVALGWDCIAVHWIDVDEEEETRILLIDNRASDLATYSTDSLKHLFDEILDLTGTGYSPEDVDDIKRGTSALPGPAPTGQTQMKIGPYGWRTPTDLYDQWADGLDATTVYHRLRLPEET